MEKIMVLEKIKEIVAKQLKPRPIGIDSLALMLGIQEIYLKPLLQSLSDDGCVVLYLKDSKSRRLARSGTLEFVNV